MSRSIYCDGKVYRIATQLFEETRGALSTIEFTRYNFYPVRAFVITAPPGTIRGDMATRRAVSC